MRVCPGCYAQKEHFTLSKIYGRNKTKLLRCGQCGITFSERVFSISAGLHSPEMKVLHAISMVRNGTAIQEVADKVGVSSTTIYRWLKRVHAEKKS